MKRRQLPFSRQYYQFRALSRKVNKMLQDGTFHTLTAEARQRLLSKLRYYFNRLTTQFSSAWLRRSMAGAAIALGMVAATPAQAQITFGAAVQNPFGITPPVGGYIVYPAAGDLDNDGDIDVLMSDYYGNVAYYQNTGTATSPAFGPVSTNPFGLSAPSAIYQLLLPAMGDMDNDGDLDIIGATYYGNLAYYQNTGSAASPSFAAPVLNPFGFTPIGSGYNQYLLPTLVDYDGDGDLDITLGGIYGGIRYLENTGTASAPAFGTSVTNPNGISFQATDYFLQSSFVDLDRDGDLDVLHSTSVYALGAITPTFSYQENIGTRTAPDYGAPTSNPFGLAPTGYAYMFSTTADFDNDGDADILTGVTSEVGGYYIGELYFFQNLSAPPTSVTAPDAGLISIYPNPAGEQVTAQLPDTWVDKDINYELMDISGKQVLVSASSIGQTSIPISLTGLASGAYLIRITDGDNAYVNRIVKQ